MTVGGPVSGEAKSWEKRCRRGRTVSDASLDLLKGIADGNL